MSSTIKAHGASQVDQGLPFGDGNAAQPFHQAIQSASKYAQSLGYQGVTFEGTGVRARGLQPVDAIERQRILLIGADGSRQAIGEIMPEKAQHLSGIKSAAQLLKEMKGLIDAHVSARSAEQGAASGRVTGAVQGPGAQLPAVGRPGARLKLLEAKIDEVSSPAKAYPAIAGFAVTTSVDERKDSIRIAAGDHKGETATLEWHHERLLVNGKAVAETPAAAFEEMKSEFRATFGDSKADWMPAGNGFDSSHTYEPFGHAGKLLSVRETMASYTGGAHPNYGTGVTTLDLRTGKPVTLDQLISGKQLEQIVARVQDYLTKNDGFAYGASDDKAAMTETVKSNFGLVTNDQGKVEIHVRLNSFVHALAGTEARLTFAAPNDAELRAKLGL